MAKTVQPIAIELGIKGGEKLGALNRSFRDLSKQVKFSDADIIQTTKDVAKFAQEAGNSEGTIKGQIKAFEGLREQATMGGKAYTALTQEISELKSTLRGSSDAVERERSNLVKLGSASKNSAKDLQYVIAQLEKLKSKVREDSAAFLQLGKDIKNLNVNLKEVEISAGKARFAINTVLSAKPERITGQIDKLNAAIASGTLEAEDLNAALRKLELLRVGAGRGPVAFRADVFSSQLGVDYFARLRKEYDNLEKTQAAITQRISEVNTELQNVSGYERRRSLTLELIQLNKELQQSIVSVTTGEQFQAMAIRQRMGSARESYAASGFGAFSAEIRRRTEAGEFTPGMQRARERARNEIIDEEAVKATTDIFDIWEQAYDRIEDAARDHKIEMARIKKSEGDLLIEIQDRQAAEELSREKAQNDKLLESFDQRLKQTDRVLQRSIAIKGSLGLSGTELSPLYEGIVGIGTSRASAEQARMGRTPQQALTDIIDAFNSDLDRTGDGFLDSERKLREAAIEFSGGSRKVRQAFEKIPLGKTPISMFPGSAESKESYLQRVRGGFSEFNLPDFVDFRKGTTRELQLVRQELEEFRLDLDPLSASFEKLERQAVTSISKIDKQLARRSRSGGRRLSAGQLAQAAGATISGGIFGGPEGFLGGAIGTVLGGPGGAFAGAAIGAQVGQFRQQIGQYAEMAAEVDRLRLGLAGASNDFQDFVAAVQATEGASNRLLIPLSDSYRIMTQLKANTVELGISTEDTRKIFEGITASIYKTGGGLAEVEGAMRAVIQVLSKGAPQAEEIRGQLGERLPAAIVDFAKFTERTPEELADAFQKSKVTLDEFVDFAKNKFDENGQYLDELASNAAYAGLRYEKALEKVQLTTGRVFQTTGAALQDYASSFLLFIDDILNSAVKLNLIQPGPNFLVNQALQEENGLEKLKEQLAEAEKEYKRAAIRFAQLDPFSKAAFGEGAFRRYEPEIANLKEAIKILEQLRAQTKEREEQQKRAIEEAASKSRAKAFLSAVEQRENAIAQARIQLEERAAQIREQAVQRAKQLEEGFAQQRLNNERQIQDLRLQLSYVEEDIAFGAAEARAIAGGADPATFRVRKEIIDLARQQKEKEISLERQLLDEQTENTKAVEQFKIDNAKAINQANEDYAKQIGNIQQQYARSVAKIVEEGTRRAGKRLEISGKIVAEFIKQGQASATLSQYGVYMDDAGTPRMLPGTVLDTQAFEAVQSQVNLYDLAAKKIKEYTKELTDLPTAATITAPAIDSIGVNISDLTARLNANKSALEATRQKIRGLSKDLSDAERIEKVNAILREQAAPVSGALMGAQTQLAEQRGVLRLRQEGYSESTARQLFAQETAAASALENLEAAREEANKQGIPVDEVEYAKIAEGIRKATEETRALTLALENLSTGDKLRTGIIELRDELKTLVDPANQIKGAANAIGTAFTDSFMSAITGSATAQEALANFFSNTAKYFLDMAAQIIQKMITMAILNQVVRVLPGGGGFKFSGGSADAGLNAANLMGGITPFAMGGIVDKPTMFAYANGGVGRFGIMGEAGPEAILPLQRGPGGKLGVQASGGSVGDVVVNVDASGTRAQGDNQSASQLGNVIGAAVQAELIKQKRPGGLLA